MSLKIKDSAGKVIAELKDEDSEPVLVDKEPDTSNEVKEDEETINEDVDSI